MSNKVPVPIYNRPEVGDVVDIDADTINTLRDRVSQAQLARAGIAALMSGAGAAFGATANPKAGRAQRVFNTLAGSALGYGLSRPVSDLASKQIVGPAAKRYSDEFNSQVNRRQLDEFAPAAPTIAQRALMFFNSPAVVGATERLRQVGSGTSAMIGSTAVALLGQEKADQIGERLFGVPEEPEEDKSRQANPLLPPEKPYKRPIDDPSRRLPPVRPGQFMDRYIDAAVSGTGLRSTGPNSASGRSAIHALDTDVGGLSFEKRLRKAKFQQKRYEAQQARQRNENRRRNRELTIGVAVSLAALLAVGFTVAQASNVIKRIRRNMKANKASMDIVKLAQMGDIEGAQMLMDREFEKASGVSAQALADATQGLSKKDLRKAAQILKRELT